MEKPYIICHMMESLDGRIDCGMTEKIDDSEHYYEALEELGCDATIEGKTTLNLHYADSAETSVEAAAELARIQGSAKYEPAGRQFYKAKDSEKWAVGVDTRGSLFWGYDPEWIEKEYFQRPIIMILGAFVSQSYLNYLRSAGISYIVTDFNPEGSIDLLEAMDVLVREFHVRRLAVVGGGHLNGSFLRLGLLDEVSMMFAAGIDAREGLAASFDGCGKDFEPVRLRLESVRQMDDIIWARYTTGQYPRSTTQWKIINYLKSHNGKGYAREIAESIGCEKNEVNSLLYDELSKKHLVVRTEPDSINLPPLWILSKK